MPVTQVIPSLVVPDTEAAAAFYGAAFGATVAARTEAAPGQRASLRLALGSGALLLVQTDRAGLLLGADSYGGAPVRFTLAAPDAAALRARALSAGAVALAGGDWLRDPFLQLWRIVDAGTEGAAATDPPPGIAAPSSGPGA